MISHHRKRNVRGRRLILLLVLLLGQMLFGFSQAPEDLHALLEEAFRRQQEGDYRGAIDAYTEFLQNGPEHAEILTNLGAAYAALGDYEQAILTYKRALELQPDNQVAAFNLGLALYKSARFSEAIPSLAEALGRDPDNLQARMLLADCHFRLGDNRKVIDLLQPYSQNSATDTGLAYLLGTAFIREDRIEEGQELIDQILGRGPSVEGHLMIGSVYRQINELKKAVGEFEKALALDPHRPGTHSLLGVTHLAAGNRDKAIPHFRQELDLNPNDFKAHYFLGILLQQDREYSQALAHLRKAEKLRPRALDVKYQIAVIRLGQRQDQKARRLLEEIVAAAPDFVEAHVSLATAYYRLQMKEAGDRTRARVLELNRKRQAEEGGSETNSYRGPQPPSVTPPEPPLPGRI